MKTFRKIVSLFSIALLLSTLLPTLLSTGSNPIINAASAQSISSELSTALTPPFVPKPPVLLPPGARMTTVGDSITVGGGGPPYTIFLQAQTNSYYYEPARLQFANSGKFVLALSGNNAITEIAQVNAFKPDLVNFLLGTNDLGNGTSGAAVWAGIKTCIIGYLRGGATWVVLYPVLPRASFAGEAQRLILNNFIANYATDPELAQWKNNIKVVPSFDGIFDPTIGVDTVDGLHPNWVGAPIVGTAGAAVVATTMAVSNYSLADQYTSSTNILTQLNFNPQLTGTDGPLGTGASGTFAHTWSASTGSATDLQVVGSKSTLGTASSFTGAIATTTLTVSGTFTGPPIQIGQTILGGTTSANTTVTAFISGTGGLGTYTVSNSQTVTSAAMTAAPTAQRLVVSGTNTTAAQTAVFSTQFGTGAVTGVTADCVLNVSLAAGSSNLETVSIAYGVYSISFYATPVAANVTAPAFSGVLRTISAMAPVASSNQKFALTMKFAPGTAAADITVSEPYCRQTTIMNPNAGFLLKRDVYPASNDNDPMWLEKAA